MGRDYGFDRRRGRLVAHLDGDERRLLASLAEQVVALVAPPQRDDEDPLVALVGIDPQAAPSDDPAVARLLPDGYRDDPEAAAQFRRFTERTLREGKAAHARGVLDALATATGATVDIADDAVPSWLGFLNDARLAVGTRLGIRDDDTTRDEFAEMGPEDPRFAMAQVYDWLTYLQDSLLQQVMPSG